MKKHRLSFFQKKSRSFIKRFLCRFVNQSDSYILQHLPESIGRNSHAFSALRSIWTTKNKGNNEVDLVRLLFLLDAVEEVKTVPGAFAELGVYKGNSAKLLHTLAPERTLYLLDTFSGFEKEDVVSDPKKIIPATSFLDTSLAQVKAFVGTAPNLRYCPGYFPSTAHYIPEDEIFALVHLDADLYQPILAGLEYFYPKLTEGAMMIVHDYSSGAWPGVKQAVDEFLQNKPEKLIRIPDKSGTVAFRKIGCP